jgi:FkbM family methyltransferase
MARGIGRLSELYFADRVGCVGKVYSFEFVEDNIDVMNKNIGLNSHIKNIEVVRRPLGRNSIDSFYGIGEGPGSSLSAESSANSIKYTTVSIDDFVAQRGIDKIDFIKMDIEGFEADALYGGGYQ